MPIEDAPLRAMDPGHLAVLRVRAGIVAAIVLALAVLVAWRLRGPEWLRAVPVVLALAFAGWSVLVAPRRRHDRWRQLLTDTELHVARGWLVRVHTVVPIARVQHIDLRQGPIERHFGVATLVVHTAGTEHAEVVVPGLARDAAETARDRMRQAIGHKAA